MAVKYLALVLLVLILAFAAACGGGDEEDGGSPDTEYPAAGVDDFPSTTATVEIEYSLDSASSVPSQGLEKIDLEGPINVTRSDPGDSDGDGKADVTTEIVEMELAGEASFGSLKVSLNPDQKTMGMVEQEEEGKDFPAASYFDVWVQVELPSSQGGTNVFAVTDGPVRMEAELSDLPPAEGDRYETANGEAVPLVAANDATKRLGSIVDALHIPDPVGGETDEPTEKPTDKPTDKPTGPTATPFAGTQKVAMEQELGCEHTQPGVQSDLLDLIIAYLLSEGELNNDRGHSGAAVLQLVSADGRVLLGPPDSTGLLKEPLVGVKINATASGPGVLQANQSAVTDAQGAARLRFPINKGGPYTVTVGSVQTPDGVIYGSAPDSERNDTYTVGQVCEKPTGF